MGALQSRQAPGEEAWEHGELTDSPRIQATVSLTFGMILFSAGIDAEAWKQIEIVLMKASYTVDRLGIARALEYMGYGYLRSGDYQNAYGAYDTAAEKYLGTVYPKLVGRGARITWPGLSGSRGILTQSLAFPGLAWTPIKTLFYKHLRVNCPSPVLSYVLIPIARIFTYLIPRLFTLLSIIQYTKASKFVHTRDQTTHRTWTWTKFFSEENEARFQVQAQPSFSALSLLSPGVHPSDSSLQRNPSLQIQFP